jgi:hypothetical protein
MEQDEQGGFCAEFTSIEDAVQAWNTRADLAARVLELEAALQKCANGGFTTIEKGRIARAALKGGDA